NLLGRHVAAKVDVTDLHDLHAVESGRQIVHGNLDAADLVVQTLSGEAVHSGEERSSAGGSGSGTEEVAAAGIGNGLGRIRCGGPGGLRRNVFFRRCSMQPAPQALENVHGLNSEIGKERAE